MKTWFALIGFLGLTALPSRAEERFVPHYAKGTVLEIGPFDRASDTYQIIAVEVPAQGPFFSRREQVLRAIPALNTNRIRRNPDVIVSGRFKSEADLPILAESEVETLRAGDAQAQGK